MLAALVSVASFARSLGLTGGTDAAALAIAARWIGVSPAQDTAFAIGDTIYLAATVTGRNGSTLVGPPIGWSSDDPGVATVTEDGIVVSRAPGTTTIVATVGSLAARSRITVLPRVAFVRIAGDSAVTLGEGSRAPASVRATDARGHVIPARPAHWASVDSAVAFVDSTGQLVGVRPGRTTLTAMIDGITAQAPITVAAVPGSLTLRTGGGQRARAGATLPLPVAVRVLDRRGSPIAGIPVRFRDPAAVPGSFEPAIVFTDLEGQARTTWTLAPMPGRQRALATVEHIDSALVVVAEAEPVAENLRIVSTGAEQRALAGFSLAEPLVVKLTDSTGLPLVEVPVSWRASDGGKAEALAPRTDSLGEVRVRWTLGRKAAPQTMTVQIGTVGTIPVHTISVNALVGPPAAITIASGNAQRTTVGAAPRRPIVLRVADVHGNPVADTKIALAASAGTLAEREIRTDSAGRATLQWTLGRAAGVQRITARVAGIEQPLEIRATALPAEAANIAFADLPAEAPVGRRLADTVWVTVTDGYGNPVPNTPVVFTARSGTVTTVRAVTDERGRAATRWTLGPTAGEQTVTASVRGTDVRGARVVRARVPAASRPAASAPARRPSARPPATAPSSPNERG